VSGWDSRRDSTVTRREPDAGAGATRPPARLCAVHPPELACELPLSGERVVLGRNPEPDDLPRLRHPTVSRQHAAVEWDPRLQAHMLIDLGSHNGTGINGARVQTGERTRLATGDVVRLGDVLCVVEIGDGVGGGDPAHVSREAIPGGSTAARQLRVLVARAAPDPSPALIVGATGTGKERVAAELHRLGPGKGDLVVVNCAAVSPPLFESQLFGHEKGAFTGATAAQSGLFRAADGGSLFLDEIGEMPLELQAKLLRAVQQGEIVPVGSSRAQQVNVRVIAATNRDLEADVERGGFRRDLYARLALWQVRVAPLAERRADVLEWMRRLHRDWLDRRGQAGPPLDMAFDAAEALLLADWPDNLRGLDRLVHALAAEPADQPITAARLPDWVRRSPAVSAAAPAAGEARQAPVAPTREQLTAVLEQNGWSVRATARHFQRDRRQIYRWIESFGIDRPAGAED